MKSLTFFYFFVANFLAVSAQFEISEFKSGQMALITRGSHDSWLIMNDNNEVAFLSPYSGKVNLYTIDLDDLKFIRSNKKGLLMAKYIAEPNYQTKYTTLTRFDDGAMDSPEYSPNGEMIAFRRYVKDTTNSNGKSSFLLPWKFSLLTINVKTRGIDTLIKEKVSCLTFINDSTVLFQQAEKDSSWIKSININTKVISDFVPIQTIARGMTSDKKHLLVHEKYKASLYNIDTKKLVKTIDIPLSMQRVTLLGDRLILTPRGESSSFMKISNGKTKAIVGSYDYEPSLSSDGKYIIVVSENFGGGVIYKL